MANDKKTIVDLANNITLEIELTDAEQAVVDAERAAYAQQRIDEDAVIAAKQADFAEVRDAKLQAALTALANHQTKMETTHTNAEVIAAVLYLIKVMIVLVKVVAWKIKDG